MFNPIFFTYKVITVKPVPNNIMPVIGYIPI